MFGEVMSLSFQQTCKTWEFPEDPFITYGPEDEPCLPRKGLRQGTVLRVR